jgi:hypothetical protein
MKLCKTVIVHNNAGLSRLWISYQIHVPSDTLFVCAQQNAVTYFTVSFPLYIRISYFIFLRFRSVLNVWHLVLIIHVLVCFTRNSDVLNGYCSFSVMKKYAGNWNFVRLNCFFARSHCDWLSVACCLVVRSLRLTARHVYLPIWHAVTYVNGDTHRGLITATWHSCSYPNVANLKGTLLENNLVVCPYLRL